MHPLHFVPHTIRKECLQLYRWWWTVTLSMVALKWKIRYFIYDSQAFYLSKMAVYSSFFFPLHLSFFIGAMSSLILWTHSLSYTPLRLTTLQSEMFPQSSMCSCEFTMVIDGHIKFKMYVCTYITFTWHRVPLEFSLASYVCATAWNVTRVAAALIAAAYIYASTSPQRFIWKSS